MKTQTKKSTSRKKVENPEPLLMDFFMDALKDIYWAEKALVKALPKMKKAATTEALKNGFEHHHAQTQEHVTRIEKAFSLLGKKAQAKKCEAMDGLIKEAESIIEETEAGTATRDVALIMAAQKVEHYEIASYGGIATLAEVMGHTEVKDLMGQTLEEEKETDETLTSIAEQDVNYEAVEEVEA